MQQSICVPVPDTAFAQLSTDQNSVMECCRQNKAQLDRILSGNILSPSHIMQLLDADEELMVLLKKIALYQEELYYYKSYNDHSPPRW